MRKIQTFTQRLNTSKTANNLGGLLATAILGPLFFVSIIPFALADAYSISEKNLACFGNNIQITLEGESRPTANISIPTRLYPWFIMKKSQNKSFYTDGENIECIKEPIFANSVFLYFNHIQIPLIGLNKEPELTVRSIDLSPGPKIPEWVYSGRQKIIDKYRNENKIEKIDSDFIKLFPTNNALSGTYVSLNYTEPDTNQPLYIECVGPKSECSIRYNIHGNIILEYKFYHTVVPISKWTELDQLMRRIIGDFVITDNRPAQAN